MMRSKSCISKKVSVGRVNISMLETSGCLPSLLIALKICRGSGRKIGKNEGKMVTIGDSMCAGHSFLSTKISIFYIVE